MDKKEVVEIVKAISTYYGNKFKMDDPGAVVAAWHDILKDYEFGEIMENLQNYVKTNRFAPSVADIIEMPAASERAIPTHQETKDLIARWDQEKEKVADKKTANKALAEMRNILKINRG